MPCIVRWPGTLPTGATTHQVLLTFDLTASMVRASGAKLPAGRALDGHDLLARLAERQPEVSRTVFWRGRRGKGTWKAVRDGSLKYVVRFVDGRKEVEGLFDLNADQGEQHDLLANRPTDADRLLRLLATWENEVRPTR